MALLAVVSGARADLVTFDVTPAFGPKGPESPHWNNYVLNAIAGIQSNTDIGNRTTNAAAYERVVSPIPPTELVYTPFNSWRGTANPNPAFQAPFLGEFGNRVHFGLHIVGADGWEFALNDLTWELDSDDSTNYFDQSGNFAGATYSATRVGINYGADGVRGGVDDTILRSGEAGTMKVNEFVYVGVGDGFFSMEPGAATDQEDINITISDILAGCGDPSGCLVDVTATYTLPDAHTPGSTVATSGTFTILLIPEPSSMALASLGMLMGVALVRRRRAA
jgi:hypothetical protein